MSPPLSKVLDKRLFISLSPAIDRQPLYEDITSKSQNVETN